MAKAFRLALSLLLIPRLFGTLMLFPLLLSVVIVIAQVFATRLIVQSLAKESKDFSVNAQAIQQKSMARLLIYGKSDRLPTMRVCRWLKKELRGNDYLEVPPGKECSPDRLDAAIHVPNPETFDISKYHELLDGSFQTLHVCRENCRPDVILTPGEKENRADVYSAFGMMLLNDARFGSVTRKEFVEGLQDLAVSQGLLGTRYLHSKGLREPISFKHLYTEIAIILNAAGLVIVALWLALKAHRKVLDYFARSGALLPMVAATGHGAFYGAIWILTFARVGVFIAAAIPITIHGIRGGLPDSGEPLFFGRGFAEILLWLIAISISMGLATLIASIADLKHRHSLLSFTYRFLPLILSAIGAVVWSATFVFESEWAGTLRDTVSSLPLFGLAAMIIAPIIKPKFGVFIIHTLLAAILLAIASRINARWFAAHLEDL